MLYVKVDAAGNLVQPPEPAMSLDAVKAQYAAQNTVLGTDAIEWILANGWAEVPVGAPAPIAPLGQRTVPDVPVKKTDGTFERRWKFETISGVDLEETARSNRSLYLKKFADSISPLRWNSWTAAQQQEVTDWYQKVLDMPKDPAWPNLALPDLPAAIKG